MAIKTIWTLLSKQKWGVMKSSLPEADRHDASGTQRDDYHGEILPKVRHPDLRYGTSYDR
ncbi:MAG: hypothetical protein WD431_13615 [Cyclobacteriaceae bacterium]